MKTKPSIFIGSSSEYANVGELLRTMLLREISVDVSVWSDNLGVFALGRSTLESLLTVPHFFDYSIMIISPDDFVTSRGKRHSAPRDNVIFELGCFLGGQGRMRAFAIILEEQQADASGQVKKRPKFPKIPTDILGEQFLVVKTMQNRKLTEDDLRPAVARIVCAVQNHKNLSFLTPLPSTVLAITYYQNFLLPMCCKLLNSSVRLPDGSVVVPNQTGFRVEVAIPRSLDRASISGQTAYRDQNGLGVVTVDADARPFPFFVAMKPGKKTLVFHDVPTTLRACKIACQTIMGGNAALGKSGQQDIVEGREVVNFAETLQHAIDTHPDGQHLKKRISVKFW